MKALLLLNPASRGGRGRKLWGEIFKGLENLGVEYDAVELKNIGEAFEAARDAEGVGCVAAVGGDGTVNAAAAGVLQNKNRGMKFGVLYAGTSPDFCRFHKIPTGIGEALKVLAKAKTRQIEVLEANGRPFFCSCNLGFGAKIAARANCLRKFFGDKFGTFFAVASCLISLKKWDYEIDKLGKICACNHLLITKMPYIAGGLKLDIPPLADGQFLIWSVQNLSRMGCLRAVKNLYKGKKCGNFKLLSGPVKISCADRCAFEFDGDPRGELPLEIKISGRKLNLICES
ncbi:MAG: hypothetical protein J6T16_00660 [Opitutales bacterium]|nr:hypothetical protein [Opitutales bacterium]